LVGKPEGKRSLIRPSEDGNIKMHLRETELEGADWIHLVQNRD
jgi:hypothetical protein